MRRFLLYGHGGSYNHGAEAIVKSTISLIRAKHKSAHITLSSHFPEQDREYNIDADEIIGPDQGYWDEEKRACASEKPGLAMRMYAKALNAITRDTTLLSVGGDNFCYPNWHRLAVFQREAALLGAKSILWGCSVEPSLIGQDMREALNSYTHILARESLSYEALRNGVHTETGLIPDPAFLLEAEPVALGFEQGNAVGINISPLVMRREAASGILMANIRELARYILEKTDMSIALIPHVMMPADNDYAALSALKDELSAYAPARVWLAGGDGSAAQYKYIISKCKLLVCARTHASIAAYSTGVPALVMGYSIKSAGIARDLGMSDHVCDIADITAPCMLRDMFERFYSRADDIASRLMSDMEAYKERAKAYTEYIG